MNYEQARFNMVEQQIRTWEVLDQRVLDVISRTPREAFVPPEHRALAFADTNIPLGNGQVMMRPNVEGRLLQALDIQESDIVLEVGTGSGYLTACLAQLAKHVYSVDIFPDFIERAGINLTAQAINNITLSQGDASATWGDRPEYDVIAVTGSLPVLPDSYKRLLAPNGRLFVIVGDESLPVMEAWLITRVSEQHWTGESLFETSIPPLINAVKPKTFVF
ncbi:MAG TPA: protein-L-isoaspartate O-methyltransferase [Gammaproteobacteria bacterium]|jgi:protein-L-isoaspartate(D-aspartate) O-methyltransferase